MSDSSPDNPPARLDERTSVPLVWVAGLVVFMLSAGVTLLGSYAYLENRFNGIDRRLIKIEAGGKDPWTRKDQQAWAANLKATNKTLNVPEVK